MTEAADLFVSVFAYVMGKECDNVHTAVLAELELGERASWPGFRTLARARAQVAPIVLSVNHSSLIAKARSLALGAFLESGASLWLSIDDDVDAPAEDVGKLLEAGFAGDVDVLVAPCALRGGPTPQLNILVGEGPVRVREVAAGVRAFPIESGGMALSVVTRAAAERLEFVHPELSFVDHTDGRRGVAAFLEAVKGNAWHGEDYAFCGRARACGLRVEALCDTAVTHAGVLATVDPRFLLESNTIAG